MKWFFSRDRDKDGGKAQADLEASGILTGDARQDEAFIHILLESIADVSSNISLEAVLEGTVAKSLEVTEAERAVVFLGKSAEEFEVELARDREGKRLSRDLKYSRSLVRRLRGHALLDGCEERGQEDERAHERKADTDEK